MNKKLIRLTESDLHRIVKQSVNKVLRESSFDSIRNGGWQEKLQQIHNIALEMAEMAKDESPNGFGQTELLSTAKDILRITSRWGCDIGVTESLKHSMTMNEDFYDDHNRSRYHAIDDKGASAMDDLDAIQNGKGMGAIGRETLQQHHDVFRDAKKTHDQRELDRIEHNKQRAADKRWMKAADSRPLHRKGSLNREF